MIGNAVGRGYFELLADLVDLRRKAFLPNGLEQKIVDRFLPIGERWKHKNYILKIISVVNGVTEAQLLRLRSPVSLHHASARGPSRASQLKPF